jgi:probable rRNA maturation factor
VGFINELYRVMAHGLLHLLGYKDKKKFDIKKIREKEAYYLNKITC